MMLHIPARRHGDRRPAQSRARTDLLNGVGTRAVDGREEDLPLLDELGRNILFKAFCALADGAVSPIESSLRYFRDEYEAHISERRCPFTGKGPGVQAEPETEMSEVPA